MINPAFQDAIQFIRKTTFRRFTNLLIVFAGYYWSRITGNTIHYGKPFSVSIEPTTSCNLRCPECPSGLRSFSRPTGMLSEKLFRKAIDEMAPSLSYLLFYFQGEPYLHPQFADMVAYANKKDIYTATSTNAHYLDESNAEATVKSGLDRLIISIDGVTQEVYEQYRIGGKLDKVLEGTRNIVKAKRKLKSVTPYIIFQFLVVKPNEHQIHLVQEIANETGVDKVLFKSAQIYDYEEGNPLIPDNEKYSRYRPGRDGKYSLKSKLFNHCWKMWHSCVITWDGQVVPCCFDKDADHPMGSIADLSFDEIWNNQKYKDFRAALFDHRKNIDICKNCTEGTKVWV